jgi:hypothetical protein
VIYLVITRGGGVLDMGALCWTIPMEKVVVPSRNPDRSSHGIHGWRIVPEKRRVMGQIVMSNIESANKSSNFGHNTEENYCFYDLIRIGRRWADERDVEWWLVKAVTGEEEVRRWFQK